MLQILKLQATLKGTKDPILNGVNLVINPGEVHYLMGKNGSGKSTLAKVLAGHPDYQVNDGIIELDGIDLLSKDPSERSRLGLFLAFQYPVEVSGVNLLNFLRLAYNSRLEPSEQLPVFKFQRLAKAVAQQLDISEKLLHRNLNEGFSGGEKKKMEILQMALLQPKYIILDETDSGLDVDALRSVFAGINKFLQTATPSPGLLVITHYHRVLDYVSPNFVHVMQSGQIKETGDLLLAKRIEKEGYGS